MNDFYELEGDLKKLRPTPVSDELRARIACALARAEETPTGVQPRRSPGANVWWSFGLGLTTVAALLVVGLTFFDQPPQTKSVATKNSARSTGSVSKEFQPSRLTQVVYDQRDEGLVFFPNDSERPLRRIRYQTRETMRWRNSRTGASLRVSYPAEQVVLTPVSFQ